MEILALSGQVWAISGGVFLIAMILWFIVGYPVWSVWASRKSGEARLAEANFAEQIAIAEADARLKSAHKNKEAEIVEAEAVAESMTKIGDALKTNEGYLRWQWIKMMCNTENEVIYVATEASLPILEATRKSHDQND